MPTSSGEVTVTAGLVLLFTAHEFWGHPAQVDARQHKLAQAARPRLGRPHTAGAAPGTSSALHQLGTRLWLPTLNKHWVVAEGVAPAGIRWAPGHDPTSALPGQVGNFAVAGHRTRARPRPGGSSPSPHANQQINV